MKHMGHEDAIFARAVLFALLLTGCGQGCAPSDEVSDALGGVVWVKDARTGFCFAATYGRGPVKDGLSVVPCENVRDLLADRRTAPARRLIRKLQYVRYGSGPNSVCFSYLFDGETARLRSNFAAVPCGPTIEAGTQRKIRLWTYWP